MPSNACFNAVSSTSATGVFGRSGTAVIFKVPGIPTRLSDGGPEALFLCLDAAGRRPFSDGRRRWPDFAEKHRKFQTNSKLIPLFDRKTTKLIPQSVHLRSATREVNASFVCCKRVFSALTPPDNAKTPYFCARSKRLITSV